jgi:hypothetical protein
LTTGTYIIRNGGVIERTGIHKYNAQTNTTNKYTNTNTKKKIVKTYRGSVVRRNVFWKAARLLSGLDCDLVLRNVHRVVIRRSVGWLAWGDRAKGYIQEWAEDR